MAGNNTYTNVFGGGVISPALDSWNSYTINSNTPIQLVWPQETAPSGNLAAQIIEFSAASTSGVNSTPAAPASGLILPPANMVSVGQFLIVNNLSPYTQQVFSYGGSTLISGLSAGAVYFLYLQQNSTQGGVWIGFQYGAATSAPNASALQGAGLLAIGTTLNQDIAVSTYTTTPVLTVANRAQLINWGATAGSGTTTLPPSATVGASWYVQFKNSSNSTFTITPQASENINSQAIGTSITLQPNDSCFMVTDGLGNWFTIGLGTTQPVFFNYTTYSVTGQSSPIAVGSTSGLASNKIAYKFTGVLTANMIVNLPAYAQTYWINNATTGNFTLTFQVPTVYPGGSTPAGATVAVAGNGSNTTQILYVDNASNVINAVSGLSFLGYPVQISQGGTGATSAGTALTNLGGTSLGTALFTAASPSSAQQSLAILSAADATALSLVL